MRGKGDEELKTEESWIGRKRDTEKEKEYKHGGIREGQRRHTKRSLGKECRAGVNERNKGRKNIKGEGRRKERTKSWV